MKSLVAPDHITMLAAVIHDMTYPLFDYKNNIELNSSSRMRAVKNTISYSFGHKGGSALTFNLKFSSQKESSDSFRSEIQLRFEKLKADFETRFGKRSLDFNVFLADKVSLKVSRHPSGRYNLEYRANSSGLYRQFMGTFIGNTSPRKFYESAFRLYHFLMIAGYDVDFNDMIKLEYLNSVMVELDADTRIRLRGWIYRQYNTQQDKDIRILVDQRIKNNFEGMGLVYQSNLFGDFGKTFMPMSLYAEGVLIPEVYFTEASLQGKKLQPYR